MDEVRNLELDTHWPYVAVDTLDVACHCFKGGASAAVNPLSCWQGFLITSCWAPHSLLDTHSLHSSPILMVTRTTRQ